MTPPGVGPRRQDLPRQGPRGPVPDRARRQAAAPVDRGRRLAGGPARAGRRAPQEPRAPRLGRRRGGARRGRRAGTRLRPPRSGQAARSSGSRSRLRRGSSPIDAPRISPDGRYIAFNATDSEGKTRIWVRALNALAAQPLPGTEGTTRPFWSPDSRFLGFLAEGKLKKIEVTGRPGAEDLRRADRRGRDAGAPKGVILFDGTGHRSHLPRLGGGRHAGRRREARPCAQGDRRSAGPSSFRTAGTFSTWRSARRPEDSTYRVGSLDSTETKTLAPAQTLVTYAPPGYLLFVRDRTLVAQPFDAKALKTKGEPIPLAEQIGTDSVGLATFSVSRDGILAYRTGESGARLLWVDRSGKELDALGDRGEYANPLFSRAGDRLAFGLNDPRSGKSDIWVRDLARGVNSRFTFGGGNNEMPVWSPDGSTIVFRSDRNGTSTSSRRPASGQGEEKLLLKSDENKFATDWSRDGRYIAFASQKGRRRLGHPGRCRPSATTSRSRSSRASSRSCMAVFSPDARFVAYQSNESGRAEIYVPVLPGRERQVAGLQRRRQRSLVARRREGDLLPLGGPEDDGGGHPGRRDVGPRPLSDKAKRVVDGWHALMPDYEIQFWNNDNVDFNQKFLREACSVGAWSRASDFVRLVVLLEHGSIISIPMSK